MAVFRPDIPLHVAELIHHLPPGLKRSIKQTLRALSANPWSGDPLVRELEGLWRYRVRRFRIIYAIDRARRIIRVLAIGHRSTIYEQAVEQIKLYRPRGLNPVVDQREELPFLPFGNPIGFVPAASRGVTQ